jgi:hypothetical protein
VKCQLQISLILSFQLLFKFLFSFLCSLFGEKYQASGILTSSLILLVLIKQNLGRFGYQLLSIEACLEFKKKLSKLFRKIEYFSYSLKLSRKGQANYYLICLKIPLNPTFFLFASYFRFGLE